MSPRLPRISATDLIRALAREGWYEDHQSGSHKILMHPNKRGRVSVPFHRGTMKTGTVQGILDQAGLSADDLRRLLR